MGNLYPTVEIFQSIQGEGINLGIPATFIRLFGCNLRCPWCDTKYSWSAKPDDMTDAEWNLCRKGHEPINYSLAEVLERIGKQPLVVITGGEPTMYDLAPLIAGLHVKNKCVAVESNGTYDFNKLEALRPDTITISPKPLNGFHIASDNVDEVKYVVDEDFQLSFIPRWLCDSDTPIWLQPEGYHMEASIKRIQAMLDSEQATPNMRLGIQLHKMIGVR